MAIVEKLHSKTFDYEVTDPSTGLIQSQGHYLLHIVYWFMLTFVVEFIDEDSYNCFAKEDGKFVSMPARPIINDVGHWVRDLHLICFIMMLASSWYVPKVLTSNAHALKMTLNFVTVPVYIFMIFWFQSGLEDLRYVFDKESTLIDVKLYHDTTICVSKDMGNIEQWA